MLASALSADSGFFTGTFYSINERSVWIKTLETNTLKVLESLNCLNVSNECRRPLSHSNQKSWYKFSFRVIKTELWDFFLVGFYLDMRQNMPFILPSFFVAVTLLRSYTLLFPVEKIKNKLSSSPSSAAHSSYWTVSYCFKRRTIVRLLKWKQLWLFRCKGINKRMKSTWTCLGVLLTHAPGHNYEL